MEEVAAKRGVEDEAAAEGAAAAAACLGIFEVFSAASPSEVARRATATARITPSTGRRSSRQSRRARPAPASSGTLSVSVPVRDVKCWRSQEGRSAVTNTLCTKMHAEELLVC